MYCHILSVSEITGKKAQIRIDPNPFHVSGGGQPGDKGKLYGEGFKADVLDCRKSSDGAILDVKIAQGTPAAGMSAEAQVDLARNAIFSRMHSGEHVLSKVMERSREDIHIYKVAVGEDATSVFFHASGPVDWEFLFASEEQANQIVREGRAVTIRVLPLEQARELPQLKANWGRIDASEIRVVEIDGFDCIACSGSHVSNTSEIGEIFIESFKGGPEDWELTFALGGGSSKAEYGRIMRRLIHKIHCKPEELERSVDRMGAENKALSKALSKLRDYLALPWEEKKAGELPVSLFALPGVPKDMAMSSLSARSEAAPDAVVLGLFDDGESEWIPFGVMCGKNVTLLLKNLLKEPELAARGGGSPQMVSGVTGCKAAGRWLAALERLSAVSS